MSDEKHVKKGNQHKVIAKVKLKLQDDIAPKQ